MIDAVGYGQFMVSKVLKSAWLGGFMSSLRSSNKTLGFWNSNQMLDIGWLMLLATSFLRSITASVLVGGTAYFIWELLLSLRLEILVW